MKENKKIKKNFREKGNKIYGGIYKILTGWNKGRYHHIINWKKYDVRKWILFRLPLRNLKCENTGYTTY